MSDQNLLDQKSVLIVDDETDVLETLTELLPMCKITRATNFDDAARLINTEKFDIAILDIMGVNGYELLKLAKKKNIIPVMLTAHAFNIDNTVKSIKEGAASYIPKEKIGEIETYLTDVLEAQSQKKGFWWRWLERFDPHYQNRFGANWKDKDNQLWDNIHLIQ